MVLLPCVCILLPGGGGGGTLVNFAGYVPLASQSPYPFIVYSVANYRPHPGAHQI